MLIREAWPDQLSIEGQFLKTSGIHDKVLTGVRSYLKLLT